MTLLAPHQHERRTQDGCGDQQPELAPARATLPRGPPGDPLDRGDRDTVVARARRPSHEVKRMSRHVVHREHGVVDEYQELPDGEALAPDSVTVTFPDGSLRTYHADNELGGIGFEFVESGILVLRFVESDHLVLALAPGAWASVTGCALGDRGRRSASGR